MRSNASDRGGAHDCGASGEGNGCCGRCCSWGACAIDCVASGGTGDGISDISWGDRGGRGTGRALEGGSICGDGGTRDGGGVGSGAGSSLEAGGTGGGGALSWEGAGGGHRCGGRRADMVARKAGGTCGGSALDGGAAGSVLETGGRGDGA